MVYRAGPAVTGRKILLKMNSVNPVKTSKLNHRLFRLQANMVYQNNREFFNDFENFLKKYEDKETPDSFVVGDVFRSGDITCVPQDHEGNFDELLLRPCTKKVITINFEGLELVERTETDLTKKEPTPISKELFWLLLYSLIIKPDLAEEELGYRLSKDSHYVFQIKGDDGEEVSVKLSFWASKWCMIAFPDFGWKGDKLIVLYFELNKK